MEITISNKTVDTLHIIGSPQVSDKTLRIRVLKSAIFPQQIRTREQNIIQEDLKFQGVGIIT